MSELVNEASAMLDVVTDGGELGKVAKKIRKRRMIPQLEDPRAELKRLVSQHAALVKAATANTNMGTDRKSRETGDTIACRLPPEAMLEVQGLASVLKKHAKSLESAMLRQLKQIPIYQHFLARVYGVGPVVAAYLVSEIDITRATKPSNLRRFCGLAVIDGHLERRSGSAKAIGGTGTYNQKLRTGLFQAFAAMWKNAAKVTADAPHGSTTKYLTIWRDYKNRMQHSERVSDGKIINGGGKTVSAKGFIHSAGWHKAADVLIEDLYIVWRAIEGLPVWPSYYAAKLGYSHGGKICVNEPRTLTVDHAVEIVGHVGATPLAGPSNDLDPMLDEVAAE